MGIDPSKNQISLTEMPSTDQTPNRNNAVMNKSNESIPESSSESIIVLTGKRYDTNPVSTATISRKESVKAVANTSVEQENTEIPKSLRSSTQ